MPEYIERTSNGNYRIVRSHSHNHRGRSHRCPDDCCRRSQAEWEGLFRQNAEFIEANGILTRENLTLKTDLQATHQVVHNLRTNNDRLMHERQRLINDNQRLVHENEALRRSISSDSDHSEQFKHRIRDLKRENAQKDHEIRELRRDNATLSGRIRELLQKVDELTARARGWKETAEARDQIIKGLQGNVDGLEAELRERDRVVVIQSDTIRSLRREVQDLIDRARRRW